MLLKDFFSWNTASLYSKRNMYQCMVLSLYISRFFTCSMYLFLTSACVCACFFASMHHSFPVFLSMFINGDIPNFEAGIIFWEFLLFLRVTHGCYYVCEFSLATWGSSMPQHPTPTIKKPMEGLIDWLIDWFMFSKRAICSGDHFLHYVL